MLFGQARADERYFAVRMQLFDKSGSQNHRSESHRYGFGILREMCLCHYRPCRTAARAHERKRFRHFTKEMLSFFDSAEIGADRDLKYILESKLAES